jgi:hypothetical protein
MDASFVIMSFFPHLYEIANPEALKANGESLSDQARIGGKLQR